MNKNDENVTFEVLTQEDTETGDLLLPIPQELLDKLGWAEGDVLEWKQTNDDAWLLSKAEK
jgi:hypothetical protein